MSESVPGTTPEVFAPVEAPVSPPQASEEVEFVQLLTPEGERVEHPDYAFDARRRRDQGASTGT